MQEDYPNGLFPIGEEVVGGASPIRIPLVNLQFPRWKGTKIQDTFGGKPIVEYVGQPMFVEIAIMKIAVKNGWSARWVETYGMRNSGPYFFANWLDAPLKKQIPSPLESAYVRELLGRISSLNGNSFMGCWDVLTWNKERILFIESKHYKKDRIRPPK